MIPRIAVTLGEPAGIGPDLLIQSNAQKFPAELIVIADPDLLSQRAQELKFSLEIILYDAKKIPQPSVPGKIIVLPVKLSHAVRPGILAVENASYVIATLERAAQGCLAKEFAAVVTGPVHKENINNAGIKFSGHTEFFAEFSSCTDVVMMLEAPQLRVALVTTHLSLREVPDAITQEKLSKTLEILKKGLSDWYGLDKPKIVVCGLNPHAGEGGYLGQEEITVINPVLEKFRSRGWNLIGPVPADTAFIPQNLQRVDCVLAMYHDQGLPVIKQMGFEEAVNVTLGLPFIRTSVDHGTALELAGTGKANPKSFIAAIQNAIAKSKLRKI